MSPHPARPSSGTDRRLVSITWPLVAITSLMLMLSLASILMLSWIRAYVNGEGMWSKAERQAIAELRLYSASRQEADYRHFRDQLAVPLGDRTARLELLKSSPRLEVAAGGFVAGRNAPDDVPGMIRMFRLFHSSSLMAPAVQIWTQGDELIQQLSRAGDELHAAILAGHLDAQRASLLLLTAERVHQNVAPLEDRFSAVLGEISRRLTRLLFIVLSGCSAILVTAGIIVSRRNILRGERLATALRASEELVFLEQQRAEVTLGSISDAVISAGSDGRITYMNAAAERLTGWARSEVQQQPLRDVVQAADGPDVPIIMTELERILSGEAVAGATHGVVLKRRDGSEVPIHERAAPMRDRDGAVIGIVLVLRDITQERAFAARLKHQATHDALTGLANRSEFEARLEAAIQDYRANSTPYSVLYLDLDQFKVINDTSGHAAGDELIKQVAWVVRNQLRRAGDVLARLGGDEFAVLLPRCAAADAVALAESIRHRIAELRFRWRDKTFVTNASIGVVGLEEALAGVSDTLSAADQACYLAKDNGRNRVHLFRLDDQQMQSRNGEMRWVERISAALENDSFVLFAQQIVATDRRTRAGARRFELLVRMTGPDGELIPPMAFIPAAERFGLMPRIDRWVLARACRELAELRRRHSVAPTCMVNLSGASVSDPDLADYVQECLLRNGLSGAHLGVELTETAAVSNLAQASQLMGRLQVLGCPIALDDFGSGMSSFSYLKALPVDFLKIDGAFVRGITVDAIDFAVVESIQRVASRMGIKTVAECVESAAALQALAAIGVDYVQGFHLHRPAPLAEISTLARHRSGQDALSA